MEATRPKVVSGSCTIFRSQSIVISCLKADPRWHEQGLTVKSVHRYTFPNFCYRFCSLYLILFFNLIFSDWKRPGDDPLQKVPVPEK